MNRLILIILMLFCVNTQAQIKNLFKFSTFYIAANGGTSLSDRSIYNVQDILTTSTEETPYDYSLTAGIRKIKRFQYEASSPLKTELKLRIVMLLLLVCLLLNICLK